VLDVSTNKIGDRGMSALSDALRLNAGLQSLKIGFNRIGTLGCESLFEGLKSNHYLQELHLDNNLIDNDSVQHLTKLLVVN